jgi:hypothetical protein
MSARPWKGFLVFLAPIFLNLEGSIIFDTTEPHLQEELSERLERECLRMPEPTCRKYPLRHL